MTTTTTTDFEYRVLYLTHDGEEPIEVPAGVEIIEVLNYVAQSRLMRVLVRDHREFDELDVEVPLTFEIEADDELEATCAGKGGACSRTVDAPGDYCWQHEPADDEGEEDEE